MKLSTTALVLTSSLVFASHAFTTKQTNNPKVNTVSRQSTVLSEATTTLNASPTETEVSPEEEKVVATLEFPPPLTKVQRVQRAAKFWSSAIPIVLSYYSKDAELRVKVSFFCYCAYHVCISCVHIICAYQMCISYVHTYLYIIYHNIVTNTIFNIIQSNRNHSLV